MSRSPLEKPELRTVLRQIADEVETAITPDHITGVDGISVDEFVYEYGSLAQACIEAGCNYKVESPDPDVYAAGLTDTDLRKQLISDIGRIANILGHEPTRKKLETYGRNHRKKSINTFGSWEAAVLEAGIDSARIPNYVPPETIAAELKVIATKLRAPPSRDFAIAHSDVDVEECLDRYPSWGRVLKSAGLDPDERDPQQETLFELDRLATELDHRPNEAEVNHYLQVTWHRFESLEGALDQAGAPAKRGLSPADSLTKNPDYDAEIPSHTDLLQELFDIKRRSARDLDDPEQRREAFEKRAVIDETHFTVQFGSLQAAFEYADTIDPRQYRDNDSKKKVEDIPPALLAEYARELADIMDRRPIVGEVVAMTDTTVDTYLDAFESWAAVFSSEFDIVETVDHPPVVPTTRELLDDIESVGANVEQPPTVAQYRDLGEFPVEVCLRRFGSWPATLEAVGIDITAAIPPEYFAAELTKETIQRASILVANDFDLHQIIVDDFHRIAIEIDRQPTWDDIETYGRFEAIRYEEMIDDIDAVVANPTEFTKFPADSTQSLRSQLIEDLQTVESLFEGYLWPRDLTLFGTFTIPTYVATFGSLNEALKAAKIDAAHLLESVTTWNAAWRDRFPEARAFLENIREVGDSIEKAPTMQEMRDAGYYPQKIYDFYDTWAEAVTLAGFDPDTRQKSLNRTKAELIGILEEITDELGHPPTTIDIQERPGLGLNAFYTHWETWDEALEAADIDLTEKGELDSQITPSAYSEKESPERSDTLGEIIDDIESTFEE